MWGAATSSLILGCHGCLGQTSCLQPHCSGAPDQCVLREAELCGARPWLMRSGHIFSRALVLYLGVLSDSARTLEMTGLAFHPWLGAGCLSSLEAGGRRSPPPTPKGRSTVMDSVSRLRGHLLNRIREPENSVSLVRHARPRKLSSVWCFCRYPVSLETWIASFDLNHVVYAPETIPPTRSPARRDQDHQYGSRSPHSQPGRQGRAYHRRRPRHREGVLPWSWASVARRSW